MQLFFFTYTVNFSIFAFILFTSNPIILFGYKQIIFQFKCIWFLTIKLLLISLIIFKTWCWVISWVSLGQWGYGGNGSDDRKDRDHHSGPFGIPQFCSAGGEGLDEVLQCHEQIGSCFHMDMPLFLAICYRVQSWTCLDCTPLIQVVVLPFYYLLLSHTPFAASPPPNMCEAMHKLTINLAHGLKMWFYSISIQGKS